MAFVVCSTGEMAAIRDAESLCTLYDCEAAFSIRHADKQALSFMHAGPSIRVMVTCDGAVRQDPIQAGCGAMI